MTMVNSKLGAAWLAQAMAQIPAVMLTNAQGQPTGVMRTGPVRLAFPQLPGEKGKYQGLILWPRGADLSLFQAELNKQALAKFPNLGQPGGLQVSQIVNPINDQAIKTQYEPFEAGCMFTSLSAEQRKPQLMDTLSAPVDASKFYAGCWVLGLTNAYGWEYRETAGGPVMKRGVSLGMTGLIFLADDNESGGGGVDALTATGGLGGTLAALGAPVDPSKLFGSAAAPMSAAAEAAAAFPTAADAARAPGQPYQDANGVWVMPTAAPAQAAPAEASAPWQDSKGDWHLPTEPKQPFQDATGAWVMPR